VRRSDWIAAAFVAAALALLVLYRAWFVEPREWGAVCVATPAPWACTPRAALLWLQMEGLWGFSGLALGLWAFLGGPFAVAVGAVALGAAGVINYNATYGLLGAALGAWAWLRREHATRDDASAAAAVASRE
jgi:hypothetical protein